MLLRNSGKGGFLRRKTYSEIISGKICHCKCCCLGLFLFVAHLRFHPNKDMSLCKMQLAQNGMSVFIFGISDWENKTFYEAVDCSHLPRVPRKNWQETRKEVKLLYVLPVVDKHFSVFRKKLEYWKATDLSANPDHSSVRLGGMDGRWGGYLCNLFLWRL